MSRGQGADVVPDQLGRDDVLVRLPVPAVVLLSPVPDSLHLQGVPYYWAHFVFRNFSGSGAPTEELFTIFQQPWKFATL